MLGEVLERERWPVDSGHSEAACDSFVGFAARPACEEGVQLEEEAQVQVGRGEEATCCFLNLPTGSDVDALSGALPFPCH